MSNIESKLFKLGEKMGMSKDKSLKAGVLSALLDFYDRKLFESLYSNELDQSYDLCKSFYISFTKGYYSKISRKNRTKEYISILNSKLNLDRDCDYSDSEDEYRSIPRFRKSKYYCHDSYLEGINIVRQVLFN
jgi:hypothetical protein